MRNLLVLRDSLHVVPGASGSNAVVAAVCGDCGRDELWVLWSEGALTCFAVESGAYGCAAQQTWQLDASDVWFSVALVAETCSVVCISRGGKVMCIRDARGAATLEGDVDAGIAAAAWSPDQSRLVLVTLNDSVLCMTNGWEVLAEVPLEPFVRAAEVCLSWRGDGEQLALTSTDASDGTTRLRLYTSELEYTGQGRNVALGPGALLRGLGAALSFAHNGSLVAVSQERVAGRPQVAFVERNGLRHGDFDVFLPSPPPPPPPPLPMPMPGGTFAWKVVSLHWDPPSALLAVGLLSTSTSAPSSSSNSGSGGGTAVQIYTRGNYHWYLKQQWVSSSSSSGSSGSSGGVLSCLGFDSEILGRLYLADGGGVRVVDLVWDVACSGTADGSAAVVDADRLLLTPLGVAVVPPPMSKHSVRLEGGVCRQAVFWSSVGDAEEVGEVGDGGYEGAGPAWGLACLCSEHVVLVRGSRVGAPIPPQRAVSLASLGACREGVGSFRMLHAAPMPPGASLPGGKAEGGEVAVVLLGTLQSAGGTSALVEDVLCCLLVARSGEVRAAGRLAGLGGQVYRLCEWPRAEAADGSGSDEVCVGVAINTPEGFLVRPVPLSRILGGSPSSSGNPGLHVPTIALPLPEPCTHISVVLAQGPSRCRAVAIGLCPRNRLYAGETLLVAGASSYAVNSPLGELMYVTVGTQPSLHFVPLRHLYHASWGEGGGGEEAEEGGEEGRGGAFDDVAATGSLERGAPRPVERGSRLVACIPGASVVVVQLPRGNLEAFEPRHLVLTRAGGLMQADDYLATLVLLRRQKVDLNLLADYCPAAFLRRLPALVQDCLARGAAGADLLALLVAALEPQDTTAGKYRGYGHGQGQGAEAAGAEEGASAAPEWQPAGKVNAVCLALRAALLPLLLPDNADAGAGAAGVDAEGSAGEHALHPALCTFAKHSPPQLEGALALVRQCYCGPVPSAGALSSPRAHAAIRYLSLLASGETLFDAALGACDFELARAVGRLCQMDPKVYLRLLEGFEAMGREGGGEGGAAEAAAGASLADARASQALQPVRRALMARAVHAHLRRHTSLADHTMDAAEAYLSFCSRRGDVLRGGVELGAGEIGGGGGGGDGGGSMVGAEERRVAASLQAACDELYAVARQQEQADKEAEKEEAERERERERVAAGRELVSAQPPRADPEALLLERQRGGLYGHILPRLAALADREAALCAALGRGAPGVSAPALASAVPPLCVPLLAKMREAYGHYCQSRGLHPQAIAAFLSIPHPPGPSARLAVQAARDMGDWALALTIAGTFAAHADADPAIHPNRVAAEILASYRAALDQGACAADGAFDSITAGALDGGGDGNARAALAAQLCVDYSSDAEAAVAILCTTRQFLPAIQVALRTGRTDLVEEIGSACRAACRELCGALGPRAERIVEAVAELGVTWADPAARLEAVAAAEPALLRALARTTGDGGEGEGDDSQSVLSLASGRTDDSFASRASGASTSSRHSGASGTTSVSVLSALSSSAGGGSAAAARSVFSIEGLEHSLLSRGAAPPAWEGDRGKRDTDRHKKRQLKRRQRGDGKDVLQVRREGSLCSELMRLAQVGALGRAVRDWAQALLLLRGSGDAALAARLQAGLDAYAEAVVAHPPPLAPAYPLPWLEARLMLDVVNFQTTGGYEGVAAEGVKEWRRLRLVVLQGV